MSYKTQFQSTVHDVLSRAQKRYSKLSAADADQHVVDERGDIATQVDKEMTDVFDTYFSEQESRYALISEEGVKDTTATMTDPDYTVILDEIDATNNMRNRIGYFGPIFGIAEGDNPTFNDVVAMGFLDLNHNTLYEAYKDENAYKSRNWQTEHEEQRQITTTDRVRIGDDERPSALLDQYMLSGNPAVAEKLWPQAYPGDYRSTAQHLAWIADGTYDFFITGNHCAYNDEKLMTAEEIAGGYLLITEANGVMTDWDGNDIGEETIGLTEQKSFNILSAATLPLAKDIASLLE